MRRNLSFSLLLLAALCSTNIAGAQSNESVFAITDLGQSVKECNALRKLDLETGKFGTVLLNGSDTKAVAYEVNTKKEWKAYGDAAFRKLLQTPFGSGVAAAAYDKKNHRLYFTPMFIDQLRYIDLATMKLYYVTDKTFSKAGNNNNDEKKIITRMTIAPNGVGYAISNDGNTFISFTTGKKTEITQLGPLEDDADNAGVSVHQHCSCGGGDMIADDEGNLYIFSVRNNVFKVNTETKTAKLVGYIRGLPKGFTTDGAAVTNQGKVLIASAVSADGYYLVDPQNWSAKKYEANGAVFRSSDLASGNYLPTKPVEAAKIEVPKPSNVKTNAAVIQLYPNPVNSNQFSLQFKKMLPGNYTVELVDMMGQKLIQQTVKIQYDGQTASFTLRPATARGVYLLKITGADNIAVYGQKIVLQ